jgi:polysaccharide export outer membrane protein
MMNKRVRQSAVRVLFCILLPGVSFAQSEPQGQFSSHERRYRLQRSDVVELSFSFTPDYDQTVTIQPDGFVALKDVGDVKFGGLTVQEATKSVTGRYSGMLHDPNITLKLKEFSKPSFIIAGEIAKPGKYDLHGDVTLTDAIAMAGGFVIGARQSEVLVFKRATPDMVEVKKYNVKQMLANGKVKEDPMLQPGDSIYIAKSAVGKIDTFMKVSRLGLYFPLP